MNKKILILGATSSIAKHTAATYASDGCRLFLASRDPIELQRQAADLNIRYKAEVHTGVFNIEEIEAHEAFFTSVIRKMGGLDGVVLASGDVGDPSKSKFDPAEGLKVIHRNFSGACSILTLAANYLEAQKQGFIVGVSSISGDIPRRSNYVYGAAKGGLTLLLQGMRRRLHPSGVRVITIKPGFVDTPMIYGMPNVFWVASPEAVGKKIAYSAFGCRDVVYLPGFWKWIVYGFRLIPEWIFKRLKY